MVRDVARRLRPYTLLLFLTLPALWPLLHSGLPRADDLLTHYYYAYQLGRLVQAGELFPRWAPDVAAGYGAPVFNTLPYAAHYLVVLAHGLGLNFLAAFKLVGAATLVLAAWSAYALGRSWFGVGPGIVAGVAYAYSPYLLANFYTRGSLPEALALALLPLLFLWIPATLHGDRTAVGRLSLMVAFGVWAYPKLLLPALLWCGLYIVWGSYQMRLVEKPLMNEALAAVINGGLLSAFFWFPALTEAQAVQGGWRLADAPLIWAELFALPPLPVDPALLNPPLTRPLPFVALLLAGLMVVAWKTLPTEQRQLWLVALVGAALAVASSLLIVNVMGLACLLMALCAGAVFSNARIGRFTPLAVFTLVVAGLPFASPPFETAPIYPTFAHLTAYEVEHPNTIWPSTVLQPPDMALNRAQMLQGETVSRFDPLPEFATFTSAPEDDGLRATFHLNTSAPFAFVYRAFYFPGWEATLDDQPIAVHPSIPEGLITADVPAGGHILRFRFGTTGAQRLGVALSTIGLIAWVLIWVMELFYKSAPSSSPERPVPLSPLWMLLASGLTLARPLLYDAGYTPLLQTALSPAGLRGVQRPVNQTVQDELTLLGWAMTPTAADVPFQLTLYWKAARPLGQAYHFTVRLTDAEGRTWSEPEVARPTHWRSAPTTEVWLEDQYVADIYLIQPIIGTPPADYMVEVTIYSDSDPLETLTLAPVTIAMPSRRACSTTPVAQFASGLIMQTAMVDRTAVSPGDTLLLDVCWQTLRPLPNDMIGAMKMYAANGDTEVMVPFAIGGDYPTSQWAMGDTVRDQIALRLPPEAVSDTYLVEIQVGEDQWAVETLLVVAPERLFTAPPVAHPFAADLHVAELFGADWEAVVAPGETLSVMLTWRSTQPLTDSLRAFVSLLDTRGQIVAHAEGLPARGARPTTGWVVGEFITDAHALYLSPDMPPGTYTLWAGLAVPALDARLYLGEVTVTK